MTCRICGDSVRIVTRLCAGQQEFSSLPVQRRYFFSMSLCPHHPPIQGVLGPVSPEVR